jgi:hypothetical protein
MLLAQDNHMVQALATDAPDQPLHIGILPWALWSDEDLFDPHVSYPLPKGHPVDPITVAQEIPWGLVPREGVDHLLGSPRRGRVFRDIDMDETSSLMGQNEQDEQHCVGDCRYDEEIQGHEVLHVVFQEGLPCRRRRSLRSDAIRLHRRLGHLDAQLVQLADDPRRAPGGIRLPHRLNELADFLGHSGATGGPLLTQAPPVVAKSLALPCDDRARLDENAKAPCQPDQRRDSQTQNRRSSQWRRG